MRSPAFVLAAGFGTRLRPLTSDRPKPLVPLLGRPLLDQAIATLSQQGFTSAVVNAHHLPEQIEAWADAHPFDLGVSVEAPTILGTGGGLRHARDLLEARFVVVNADVLCDVDLQALLDGLPPEGGAVMALRDGGPQYGIVAYDGSDTVVDLVGLARAAASGPIDRSCHFTGLHALDQGALDLVPPGEACIVRTAYTALVPQRRVRAHRHPGIWVDLGNPQLVLDANLAALAGTLALPLDTRPLAGLAQQGTRRWGTADAVAVHPSATLAPPYWLGHGAAVGADAVVGPGAVIGAGATVGAGARVRHAVVWDGAAVAPEARLAGAIVHDSGVLEGLVAPPPVVA